MPQYRRASLMQRHKLRPDRKFRAIDLQGQ